MALTDTAIKNLKPQSTAKKYSDSGGLHLLVNPTGSKLWRLSYRFNGKQKLLSFGSYPAVSLSDARRKREYAKALLAAGTDPGEQAKLDRRIQRVSSANTFDAVADELLAKFEREGRAGTTMTKKRWLLSLISPAIGSRPIAEITAAEILEPLRAVEAQGNYETARRMRSTAGQVFRYAIATSRAENDPAGALRGALTTPTVTHHAAIIKREPFGGLLRAVWAYEGTPETKAALQLMAMLYPRPGELRQSHWSEFDLDGAKWTIPSLRMKMRREHVKPLSSQAITVLRELHKHTGDGALVFPSIKSRKQPISENTLNGALRRLGFTSEEMTSHGFRASASTLLNESKQWPADAIEAELAHVGADQVRRVYHRALYWDDRVKMAQAWADDIDQMRKSGIGAFG